MKCDECEILIEEFVYGELDEQLAAQVAAHLSGCAACSEAREEFSRELELYSRYERDVEVTPALWARVAARIKQEEVARPSFVARLRKLPAAAFGAPRLSPAFAAAIVLIAIGVTVAVTTYLNSRNNGGSGAGGNAQPQIASKQENENQPGTQSGSGSQVGSANQSSGGTEIEETQTPAPSRGKSIIASYRPLASRPSKAAEPTPEQLVREAEQKYLSAIAILERDVNRNRSKLDPALLAQFNTALAQIDQTIAETRRAVRQNPDDPTALKYLLSAYSKKVDVLRDMSRGAATEQ